MDAKAGNTFFIHATNVHVGGGKSLLNSLLSSLPAATSVMALLDHRMVLSSGLAENLQIRRVSPTIWQRLTAEWWLVKNANRMDTVLCFGNLPPIFRLKCHVIVFVQNRYLVDSVTLSHFSAKTRLRLLVERLWFWCKATNASAFLVQTPSMKRIIEQSGLTHGKPVYIAPFVNDTLGYSRTLNPFVKTAHTRDFIYVASGEPHKNHRALIESWCLLAGEGYFPNLCITLDPEKNVDLCHWIQQKTAKYGLRIENLGVCPPDQIRLLYAQSKALIYPSNFESFGLPLVEARQAGLAILASELDFVRDVIDPEQSFDPSSPVSISRAVKRFMGWTEFCLPLLNATDFLDKVLNKCE